MCYWHSFAWNGFDVFGADGFDARGTGDRRSVGRRSSKADAAFDFFVRLGVPFYCFHDRDVAPRARRRAVQPNLDRFRCMVDVLALHGSPTQACACCGAQPTCSATGASSPRGDEPEPRVFALAALPG